MKGKKVIIITIILSILITIIAVSFLNEKDQVQITQLSPQSFTQMMGYIIKTNKNKIIAIDGGNVEDTHNWIKHIEKLGKRVDYWFITHPHKDHAGVFKEIMNENTKIEVGTIYYTANDLEWYKKNDPTRAGEAEMFYNIIQKNEIKEKAKEVDLNQKIKIDNIDCEILGVKNPEITKNPTNNSSMIIKMNINNKSILFLGDAGIECGQKLLQDQRNKLKSDIVQMSHHGQSGVTQEVYKAIQPKICLWPTTQWLWDNDLGHGYNTATYKTIETRQWIEDLGIEQNIVAKDGDKTIEI